MPRSRRKDGFKTKVTADEKGFSTAKSPKKAKASPKKKVKDMVIKQEPIS